MLNLALWYLPALMLPGVVWVARRFPLDTGRRLRAVAVHAAAALTFASVHFIGLTGVRFLLWTDAGKWPDRHLGGVLQRRVFEQLDWSLMVYAVIVGVEPRGGLLPRDRRTGSSRRRSSRRG